MKVSVAMATFNGAKFLQAQLDSLRDQVSQPDEIIITDDCSSDETLEVLQKFSKDAPFDVRVVQNSANLGYAQNFGKALSLCTGDIIFLCDQDDRWFENKISVMLEVLDRLPEKGVLLCDTAFTDAALCAGGETKLASIRANGLPDRAHVMGCCMAIRRELLELALPIPRSMPGHDKWIAQIADELGLSERLEQTLQYYRLHGRNASDFFVNRNSRPSFVAHLMTLAKNFTRRFTASSGIEEEHCILTEVLLRIDAEEDRFAKIAGPESVKRTMYKVSQQVEALSKRLAIRKMPRTARIGSIWALWRAGVYQGRLGIASAVKDLVLVAHREKPRQE